MTAPQLSLKNYLQRFSRYLRVRDSANLVQKTLWIAGGLAVFIQIIGHFLPIKGLIWWTIAPILCLLLATIGYSLLRPIPPMHIARRIDMELGLFERLSTSLALDEHSADFPSRLVQAQQLDTIRIAQGINPRQAFRLRWQHKPVAAFAFSVIVLVTLSILPNQMNGILAERAAVRQEALKQAERIEKLEEKVAQAEGLTDQERQDLQRQLEELAQKLRTNPGDLEEALADISRLEEALKEKLDPNAASKATNLEALAVQLAALTGKEPDPSQDAAQSTADALSQLAEQMADMDAAQRQELAQALAQMAAQAAQAGNADLAKAISEIAQALQAANQAEAQNNPQAAAAAQSAAQAAAQRSAQAFSQAQQQMNSQQALQQAVAQLQASRQSLSQASSQALAQAGQTSQSGASGQTPSQGAGSGLNPAQGAPGQGTTGGGGTNASTLPPSTGQGQPSLNPQGSKPSSPESDLSNQVYAPRQQGSSNGDELFIPGQDTGQGESTSSQGETSQPGTLNPSLVPYYDVFYQYLLTANQSMQQSYIPISLLQYIQAYFLQLEQIQ